MEFHDIANVFPMLPQVELETLAADIKANGLPTLVLVCRQQNAIHTGIIEMTRPLLPPRGCFAA